MSWNCHVNMSQCEKKNPNYPKTGFIFFIQMKIIAMFYVLIMTISHLSLSKVSFPSKQKIVPLLQIFIQKGHWFVTSVV